jgi:hypothetical protein
MNVKYFVPVSPAGVYFSSNLKPFLEIECQISYGIFPYYLYCKQYKDRIPIPK